MLAVLLFLYGNKIPLALLQESCMPQPRWHPNGGIIIAQDSHHSRDSVLLDALSDASSVRAIVDQLISRSAVFSLPREGSFDLIGVDSALQKRLKDRLDPEQRKYWHAQAIMAVCQAFPQDRYLEPRWVALMHS